MEVRVLMRVWHITPPLDVQERVLKRQIKNFKNIEYLRTIDVHLL